MMQRRNFVKSILGTSLAVKSLKLNASAAKSVSVFGAGIAGLTAAQELAERGFQVTVYEKSNSIGGKAKTVPIHLSERCSMPWQGEHGFRFFPGFYRNVIDTMLRIPNRSGGNTASSLVGTRNTLFARKNNKNLIFPTTYRPTAKEMLKSLHSVFGESEIPFHEQKAFYLNILTFLTSGDSRRNREFEYLSWDEFLQTDYHSENYHLYYSSLTRALVAAKSNRGSAKTIGKILIQLMFNEFQQSHPLDQVLDGPTSEVWFDPWQEYLESIGVKFHFNTSVEKLNFDHSKIDEVMVIPSGFGSKNVKADYYVLALPAEAMQSLLTRQGLPDAEEFQNIAHLELEWMNGIQLFLKKDTKIIDGHLLFIHSPWALTAISQNQFWKRKVNQYQRGAAEGILSIDISEWEAPGLLVNKPAKYCSFEEIKAEVLYQMRVHFNDIGSLKTAYMLRDDNIIHTYIDESLTFDEHLGQISNASPLLVNTIGSWKNRPSTISTYRNLFLASDYIRTSTDLASMESANESGRRAANGILESELRPHENATIYRLEEPKIFEKYKTLDDQRYANGQSHVLWNLRKK